MVQAVSPCLARYTTGSASLMIGLRSCSLSRTPATCARPALRSKTAYDGDGHAHEGQDDRTLHDEEGWLGFGKRPDDAEQHVEVESGAGSHDIDHVPGAVETSTEPGHASQHQHQDRDESGRVCRPQMIRHGRHSFVWPSFSAPIQLRTYPGQLTIRIPAISASARNCIAVRSTSVTSWRSSVTRPSASFASNS